MPEVAAGRSLAAVRAAAEVDVIEIQLENFVLRELALDLARDADLERLSLQRALCAGQPIPPHVARELHGDGAETLRNAARLDVCHERSEHAAVIDAAVLVKTLVFHRHKRLRNVPREVLQRDDGVL